MRTWSTHMPGSVINLSDLLETCRDCTAPGCRPWDVSLWLYRIWGRVFAGYPGYIRHLCLLSAGQHLSASLPHNKAMKWAGVGRAPRSHGHRGIGPGKVQRLSPSLLDAVFHYLHMKWPWLDVSLPILVFLISSQEFSRKSTTFRLEDALAILSIYLFYSIWY